jgi:dipeptidase E
MITRTIVALGGGGFSEEPENPLLDRYILSLSSKPRPKICFIPTASGDSDGYIARFHEAFNKMACEPIHLSLFRGPTATLESYLSDVDIIYVGGGNTRNLMVLWREWGLDAVLKKAWERGVILAGISAGSLCWFEQGVTDSIPGSLTAINCLGFLPGSNCVHYDGEANRRPSYHGLVSKKLLQPGLAAEDGVALHFQNQQLLRVVTSRPNRKAYRVTLSGGNVEETAIVAEYLGD